MNKSGDEILAAVAADTAQHLRDMELPVDEEEILQFRRVALEKWRIDRRRRPDALNPASACLDVLQWLKVAHFEA